MYALFLSRIQWANCADIEETERRVAIAFTNICFCPAGKIPEEAKALSLLAPATPVPSLIPGGGLLPIPTPAPLQNVSQRLVALLLSCLFVMQGKNLTYPAFGDTFQTQDQLTGGGLSNWGQKPCPQFGKGWFLGQLLRLG